MQRLKLFLPLIVFVLIAGFFFSTMQRIEKGQYDPQTLPLALLNKPFPAFALPDLTQPEQLITNKQLLGQISLVNVWATWCPSCHVEHGYLNYLASQKNVKIVGVNYKDEVQKARAWLKNKGNPYTLNIVDQEGRLGLDMGVTGAPETYVIDHRGFVRMRYQGPLSETVWQEKFQALYKQLQQEQQADRNHQQSRSDQQGRGDQQHRNDQHRYSYQQSHSNQQSYSYPQNYSNQQSYGYPQSYSNQQSYSYQQNCSYQQRCSDQSNGNNQSEVVG